MFKRQTWLAVTRTEASAWLVPARVLLGGCLLLRLDGGLCEQLAVCRGGAHGGIDPAISGAEFLLGASLVAGAAVRIAAPVAVLDFALRSLAGWPAAFPQLFVSWIVVPNGDWAWAATMLGAAVLALDIAAVGSGSPSVDAWLHARLLGPAA